MNSNLGFKQKIMIELKKKMDQIVASGGLQLPPEKQLAQELQVSRETIRALLLELEHEGKIFRRHGSGTFINKHSNKAGLLYPCQLFRDVIAAYGYQYRVETVCTSLVKATEEVSTALGVALNTKICKLDRIYYADEHPCILSTYHFSLSELRKQDMAFLLSNQSSIYDIINRLASLRKSSLLWDDTEIYAVKASDIPQLKKHCEDDTPFLVQETTYYNDQNMPLLYSVSYINTQIIHFHFVRSKQP